VTQIRYSRYFLFVSFILVGLAATGCQKKPAAPARPAMQGLPVQTVMVAMQPVPQANEYVATIKSRRSATMSPQVSGQITEILAHSGEQVNAGQVLMLIDPRQQQANVAALLATERQKKAVYDYDTIELDRQKQLFEAGVTSRDAYDQAQQAYQNAKADYEAAEGNRKTQEQLLAYYTIRAPYAGTVGDIPVHVGDYVSSGGNPPTLLTTVDENKDLEAYIYVPTERSGELRRGLPVDVTDDSGKLLEKTAIDFVSPQVDSSLQGILVKAPVDATHEMVRNAELVKARVIWSTKPMAIVPVLAVSQQGEQSFVFVVEEQHGMNMAHRTPVILGPTVDNNYAIASGLRAGDRVIVSGTQFLVDGMPVILLPGAPQSGPPQQKGAGAHGKDLGAHAENSAPGGKAQSAAVTSSARRAAVAHHHRRRHRRALARKTRHTQPGTVS
jgi:RND family efflux transporter MFP subunit